MDDYNSLRIQWKVMIHGNPLIREMQKENIGASLGIQKFYIVSNRRVIGEEIWDTAPPFFCQPNPVKGF